MAIYHLSAKTIGRKAGRSSTAAAAYRAGCEIADERTGEVHDYSRKAGVELTEIIAPDNAPEWAHDRSQLWNKVEAIEKRKDAQLCREIVLALPDELDKEQRQNLVRGFVKENMTDKGMVADVAFHAPNKKGDERNHHAHVMLTMRPLEADGFGNKERAWNDKALLEQWRAGWAKHQNDALAKAGVDTQVDHRSYEVQGVDRVATTHMGPVATAMERRGVDSSRGDINRQTKAANDESASIKAQIIELKSVRRKERTKQKIRVGTGRTPLNAKKKDGAVARSQRRHRPIEAKPSKRGIPTPAEYWQAQQAKHEAMKQQVDQSEPSQPSYEHDKPQPIKTDPHQPLHERMKYLVDVIAKSTWLEQLKEMVVKTLRSGVRAVEDASLIDEVDELKQGKKSLNTAIDQTTVGGVIDSPEGQSLITLRDDVDQQLKPLEAAAQAEKLEREAKAKAEIEVRLAREAEERQKKREADPEYQRQKRLDEAKATEAAMRKSIFDRSLIIEYEAQVESDSLMDEKRRVDNGLSEALEAHQKRFPEKPKGLFKFGAKKAYESNLEAWETAKQGIENEASIQKAKIDDQLEHPQMLLRNKDSRNNLAREQISQERPADYQKAVDAQKLIAEEQEREAREAAKIKREAKLKDKPKTKPKSRNRGRGGGIEM